MRVNPTTHMPAITEYVRGGGIIVPALWMTGEAGIAFFARRPEATPEALGV